MRHLRAIYIVLCTAAVAGCSMPLREDSCRRKFDDAQVERLASTQFENARPHQTQVEWRDCRYHVLFFWLPITPDSHTYAELDANGNVVEPVREEASYRKVSIPAYPLDALAAKITGIVYLRAWIRADGNAGDIVVEQIYPRDAAALAVGLADTVRTWKFNPAMTIYGNPVASENIIPVRFGMGNRAPSPINDPQPPKHAHVLDTIEVEGASSTICNAVPK